MSVCVCYSVCIGDELYDHHIICAIIVALRLVCHSQSNVFVPTAHTHDTSSKRARARESARKNVKKRRRLLSSRKHQQCTQAPLSLRVRASIYVYHSVVAISRIDSNETDTGRNVNETLLVLCCYYYFYCFCCCSCAVAACCLRERDK